MRLNKQIDLLLLTFMDTIAFRLKHILDDINAMQQLANRPEDSVLLLAVSKTKPATDIAYAYQAGQRHFGENYCQEALKKQQLLSAFDITWHFIGPIQSNKTKDIAAHFDWVHSVNSLKIAKRLDQQRPNHLPPLNICLQVNISNEASKSGIDLAELAELCAEVALLPRLLLRGVMAIPSFMEHIDCQRQPYRQLRQAVEQLNNPYLNTYSFGMSGDLQAAILEGSTVVRIGTALFGRRA